MRVGDLITIKTIGWNKTQREKYENRAGIITKITDFRMGNYRKILVDFGDGEIEVSESRLRLLEEDDT